MSKSMVAIVALLVGGASVYFVLNNKDLSDKATKMVQSVSEAAKGVVAPAGTASGTASLAGQTIEPSATIEQGTIFSTLSSDIGLAVSFNPRNFAALFNYVVHLHEVFSKTKIWTSFDLDQMILAGWEQSRQQAIAEGKPDPTEVINKLKAVWNSTGETVLAASSKTISLGGKLEIPQIIFEAKVSDADALSKLTALLDQDMLKGQTESKKDNVTIKRISNDAGTSYLFSAALGSSGMKLPGSLAIGKDSLALTIGAPDASTFKTTDSAQSLVASAQYRAIASAVLPDAAVKIYAQPGLLGPIGQRVFAAIAESSGDPEAAKASKQFEDAFVTPYADFDAVLMSVNFAGGANTRNCVGVKAGSKFDTVYNSYFAARGDGPSGSIVPKLLESGSILGTQFALSGMPLFIDWALASMTKIEESITDPEAKAKSLEAKKNIEQMFAKLRQLDEKLGFRTIGAVVNSPVAGPIPEFGILLGESSKLKGSELLAAVAEFINSVAPMITEQTGQGAGVSAKVSAGTDGKEALYINGPEGTPPLIGGLVGDNSVLFAISDQFIGNARTLVAGNAGFTSTLKGSMGTVADQISASDFALYLNTTPLINVGKAFLPMLMMSAPIPVEMADVDEFVDHLGGVVVSSSRNYRASPQVVCTEGKLVGY